MRARIRLTASLGIALASIAVTPHLDAQQYPTKPIRLVVASSAGGGIDVLARIIAPKFAELIGQPVLVDNRPGAGGTMGYEYGIRSAPDGYTLTIISSSRLHADARSGRDLSLRSSYPQKCSA